VPQLRLPSSAWAAIGYWGPKSSRAIPHTVNGLACYKHSCCMGANSLRGPRWHSYCVHEYATPTSVREHL